MSHAREQRACPSASSLMTGCNEAGTRIFWNTARGGASRLSGRIARTLDKGAILRRRQIIEAHGIERAIA